MKVITKEAVQSGNNNKNSLTTIFTFCFLHSNVLMMIGGEDMKAQNKKHFMYVKANRLTKSYALNNNKDI
jgi:hypothetical protein